MAARILSTNLAQPRRDPGGADRVSGINKRPVPSLAVFEPGPSYGDGSGVVDDTVGDSEHHGGAQKAVYAFAREELDHWQDELSRPLRNGTFGENLTTTGIVLEDLVINQQIRIGDEAVLEVSVPRTPCRTFGGWMDEPGWTRRFAERGRPGSYFRVVAPGTVTAGDPIIPGPAPDHGITMAQSFRAAMGDVTIMRALVDAACLPAMYHQRYIDRLAARQR